MLRKALITTIFLGGCVTVQPLTNGSTLILKPQILAGTQTQALLPAYDKSSINHLKLALYPLVGGIPQAKIVEQTLLNAQLDNPVVFSNLKANSSYRIQASAYYSADDSQLISIDASSSTDITLVIDDRPTLSTLQVKLMDRTFSGQATSSLNILNGAFSQLGPEGMVIPKLVTTFAGSTGGHVDGAGTAAKLKGPRGMAIDANGTIYVADNGNNSIRAITPYGVVSTLAGGGSPGGLTAGFQDGTGTNALFNYPSGVTIDNSGNLYVSEWNNHAIRKVTPAGVVTTIAGNGSAGSADGLGSNAQFNAPMGIVFAPDGYLYVADFFNGLIRKVSTAGNVTTFAGTVSATGSVDGIGTAALFYNPHSITVNPAGDLFVGDVANYNIRKITPARVVTTFAGGAFGNADGTGTAALFNSPYAITYGGNGLLYVGEDSSSIRRIDVNGVVTTIAGNGSNGFLDGLGTAASFYHPRGIVTDSLGNIYVSDSANQKIRKLQ